MNKKTIIPMDKNQKQLIISGDYAFPLAVNYHSLSDFEENQYPYHWHPEIEFDIILSGSMRCHAHGHKYTLSAGDALFCNSNCLHSGYLVSEEDCRYIALTFFPRFIYGFSNSCLETKYVTPILNNPKLQALPLRSDVDWQQKILEILPEVCKLYDEKKDSYELRIHNLLCEVWLLIYENTYSEVSYPAASGSSQATRLERILAHIHGHYNEQISLNTISELAGLSTSECCRFFKKHMHMSIFDYLQEHRIKCSLSLLADEERNITETASAVGFSSSSYFTQVFKKYMGITPSEYKREIL